MSDQTLVYVLIFVFGIVALLALGARSFTQLVELILKHGLQVDQQTRETLQAAIASLTGPESKQISSVESGTPTTQESPDSSSTDSTSEIK